MSWLFTVATIVAGVRVVLMVPTGADSVRPSIDVVGDLMNVCVGLAMTVLLALASRLRRDGLDERDRIDLMTVLLGSTLSTWILIASRLIFDADVAVLSAIGAAAYLPVALLLLAFVVDLLFTGLHRNRAMHFLTLAAIANMFAAGTSTFELVGVDSVGPRGQISLYVAAVALLAAAFTHPHAPEILSPTRTAGSSVAYTPIRLVLTGICLVVPGVLVASLAPFGSIDVLVRVTLLIALVSTVVARLFIAVKSHEAVEHELTSRLHLDDVTQLPTRQWLVAELAQLLEATWRSEIQPTIIQLNLDRFKNINDSLGHADANEVLVTVGRRLVDAAATFDGVVARVGGDDFVVMDPATTSSAEARERLDVVKACFADPVTVGDHSVFVTASFGVAMAPNNRTLTPEEFMRHADIATHRAKGAGRNSIAVFDDSMQAHLATRMDVEHALHGAIGRQEMLLYYQPIVDIHTGELSGFEALMRWQRDGTIVPPLDFIPIAEETGIICELGEWALNEALSDLRGWIDDDVVAPTATMSVNVSPRQIADPNFGEIVSRALRESNIPTELLWLEMTESMMLEEPELAEITLRGIREMGVRLALDDFGTGYSSLSLLQQFPIHRLKIDRAFVNGIAEDGNDRSLVRTVIAMAQSMSLDLVAEGVETVEQLQVLNEMNCDKAQGYLISRPVPPDAMRSTMVALDELTSLSMFSPRSAPVGAVPAGSGKPPTGRDRPQSERFPIGAGPTASRPLGRPMI